MVPFLLAVLGHADVERPGGIDFNAAERMRIGEVQRINANAGRGLNVGGVAAIFPQSIFDGPQVVGGVAVAHVGVSIAHFSRMEKSFSSVESTRDRNHDDRLIAARPSHHNRQPRWHPVSGFLCRQHPQPAHPTRLGLFPHSWVMIDFVSYALPAPSFMAGRFEVVARRRICSLPELSNPVNDLLPLPIVNRYLERLLARGSSE